MTERGLGHIPARRPPMPTTGHNAGLASTPPNLTLTRWLTRAGPQLKGFRNERFS
jgi:hypothetical protein